MAIIKKFFIFSNIILFIATIGVYINYFVPPDKIWIFPVLGLFFPIFFFLHCFYVVLWLFQDVKWMWLSTFCILLGWNHTTGFIGLTGSRAEIHKTDIGLLTLNTHFFKEAEKKYGKNTGNEVLSFLESIKTIDIINLQEFPFKYEDQFLERLKGYEIVKTENKRAVIFSKYPVVAKGEINFGTKTNSCVWADLQVEGQTIRVYSIHLQSNSIADRTDNILDNLQFRKKQTWGKSIEILRKYRRNAIVRHKQAKLILEHSKKTDFPILMAGDLNEPPNSNLIRMVAKDLNDTFKAKAKGIGSTYGGRIPFLRIDYIFASDHFEIKDYKTYSISLSDHLPISARFKLKREKNI